MKQVRLLPVVIVAALALLVLKGFGVMTGGGYVLTGPSAAQAAGGAAEEADPAESGDPQMDLPAEPTLTDSNPTMNDGVPTMALPRPGAQGEGAGEATEEAHGAGDDAGTGVEGAADGADDVAGMPACPPAGSSGQEGDDFDFTMGGADCVVDPGVNEAGDAVPLIRDAAGNLVPLGNADGVTASESAIVERLAERRHELDELESELDMRMALVEAAEKRIEERTVALEALEARISAMVDEKRALEESQFVSVVAMYETMKPKDAAAIFDELEMPVLLRVARAVNPRKMAPIMAKMDPVKAKDLTAGLAVDQVEPTIDMSQPEDLAALPQIIGQ